SGSSEYVVQNPPPNFLPSVVSKRHSTSPVWASSASTRPSAVPRQIPGATIAKGRVRLLELDDMAPAQLAGRGVEGIGAAQGGDVERASHLQQAAAEPDRLPVLAFGELPPIHQGSLCEVVAS